MLISSIKLHEFKMQSGLNIIIVQSVNHYTVVDFSSYISSKNTCANVHDVSTRKIKLSKHVRTKQNTNCMHLLILFFLILFIRQDWQFGESSNDMVCLFLQVSHEVESLFLFLHHC